MRVDKLCPVESFALNKNYAKLANYTVAIIGDSLDLHACFELARRQGDVAYDANGIPLPNMLKSVNGSINCYGNNTHINVKFHRIAGIMQPTGARSGHIIKSVIKFLQDTKPDAIVFSSIVHDIRNNHIVYCGTNLQNSTDSALRLKRTCLCDHHHASSQECLSIISPHIYNQIEMPWCDENFVDSWRSVFTGVVKDIRAALPYASVFLRNQPFASQMQLGHQICLGSLNYIVREVTTSLVPHNDQCNSCRLLDMSALLARAASKHMGYTTSIGARDGLHYFKAVHIWVDYMLNTIIDNAVAND